MKVYCEHHAVREWLRDLQEQGYITLVLFPYDQRNRRIKEVATPSEATWEESDITWDEANFPWDDFSPSSHYSDICDIIGKENIKDAKHVDSAFKSQCHCMLTCDDHILSHTQELGKLLSINFFNPDKDRDDFMIYLKTF